MTTVTTLSYVLLGAGAVIVLLAGVAGCLWIVQLLLNRGFSPPPGEG